MVQLMPLPRHHLLLHACGVRLVKHLSIAGMAGMAVGHAITSINKYVMQLCNPPVGKISACCLVSLVDKRVDAGKTV